MDLILEDSRWGDVLFRIGGNASGKSAQETSGCPKLKMLPGQIWKV